MRATISRQIPNPNPPTQFALVPPGRLVHLIAHYEAMRVAAEHLPPAPHRPPPDYVRRTLAELRRELVAREFGVAEAA